MAPPWGFVPSLSSTSLSLTWLMLWFVFRRAIEELLKETDRARVRAETMGPAGWWALCWSCHLYQHVRICHLWTLGLLVSLAGAIFVLAPEAVCLYLVCAYFVLFVCYNLSYCIYLEFANTNNKHWANNTITLKVIRVHLSFLIYLVTLSFIICSRDKKYDTTCQNRSINLYLFQMQ